MVQNIHIQINRSRFYVISKVSNPLALKVTEYEPYDKSSQKFNRYTHVIQYKSKTDYNPHDYVLILDDPNAWYYTYIIYLYEPTKKIVSVDIYFLSDDIERRNPLIFGFNYEKDPSVYYTYYYVRGVKYFTGTMGSRGSFGKDDLISRLIDERGIYKSDSYHKFVIRLHDKPRDNTPTLYPKGGNNSGMITLKRAELQDHPNYVQYEHVISPKSNVESFYIAFHQDTLYMIGETSFGKLKSVIVYYNKHDGANPVVVLFKFERRHKLYKFSLLVTELSNKTKHVSSLIDFGVSELKNTLSKEYKNVNKEITFNKGKGENKFISVTAHRFNVGNKDEFRRVILKPNTDVDNKGSSTGPWEVSKEKLLYMRSKTKLEDYSLDHLHGSKFSSIYVYYNAKNDPLLVGFIGESEINFFRISKGGQSWEKDEEIINIYSDTHLIPKLRQLEIERTQPVSDVQVSARRPGPHIPAHKKPGQIKHTIPPRRAEPPRVTVTVPDQPKIKSITLNLSKSAPTTYDGIVTVSQKVIFNECNLFCYFKHTVNNHPEFTISSITDGSSSTTSLKIIQNFTRIQSVLVYYNIKELTKPLLLEFHESSGITSYFVNTYQSRSSYSLLLVEIEEYQIVDELIEQSDKFNNRWTFQIDKASQYNGINVATKSQYNYGFTIYTHSSDEMSYKKSNVLYNNQFLIGLSNNKHGTIEDIQDKNYKEIVVYSLNAAIILPVVIKFNYDRSQTTTYIRKHDGVKLHWEKKEFTENEDAKIKAKLEEICYLSSKSILVEIDKRVVSEFSYSYDMKIIDNKSKNDSLPEITKFSESKLLKPSKKILVINENLRCPTEPTHSFKCYSHIVVESSGASEIDEIYGLRLYIPKIIGTDGNMDEVELYKEKSASSAKRVFLHYAPDSDFGHYRNKVFVYFYHYDPRPLLISYNNEFFRRIDEKNSQWYHDPAIKFNEKCALLATLKDIYKSIKKKLIFVKDGHLGSITPTRLLDFGNFRKDTYTAYLFRDDEHFYALPKHILIGDAEPGSIIDKLMDKLDRSPFDEVNVFMKRKDNAAYTLKDILLFEFKNESKIIHFKRKDEKGNYWVEDLISYSKDPELQKELDTIHNTIGTSLVYELDKKSSERSNIKISQPVNIGSEFTKYVHTPSGGPKSFLIFYKNEKLLKKVGHQYLNFTDIDNLQLSSLTVYFGNKETTGNANCPLMLELNVNHPGSARFYIHKRDEKSHYWEQTNLNSRTFNNELINKLGEAQFDLVDSIVLLMDKLNSAYGDMEVKKALEDLQPSKVIHLPRLDAENIKLNRSGQTVSCVSKYGFKMTEHYLGTIAGKENCGLRFFIPDGENYSNYKELTLYDSSGRVKQYLYYDSHIENVHFFYYGDDPRPLLVCYGGKAYKPIDKSSYYEKWCRVDRIKNCNCQKGRQNADVMDALSEVVGMLNEVKLETRPYAINSSERAKFYGTKTVDYIAQTYAGNHIKVRVSYENGSCYRLYRHEPVGILDYGPNFRLGNITFDGAPNFRFDYDFRKQLKAVTVYYSLYDVSHHFPLLISLRYGDNSYDHYGLVRYSPYSWRFIEEHVYETDVETKAYEILEKLNINFDRKSGVDTLFNSDQCSEGGSKAVVIGGSVGGVVGTAAVTGGVTLAVHPEWVVPVINALT